VTFAWIEARAQRPLARPLGDVGQLHIVVDETLFAQVLAAEPVSFIADGGCYRCTVTRGLLRQAWARLDG
jgi:hypothetical protein